MLGQSHDLVALNKQFSELNFWTSGVKKGQFYLFLVLFITSIHPGNCIISYPDGSSGMISLYSIHCLRTARSLQCSTSPLEAFKAPLQVTPCLHTYQGSLLSGIIYQHGKGQGPKVFHAGNNTHKR